MNEPAHSELATIEIPEWVTRWAFENANLLDTGETEVCDVLPRLAAVGLADRGAPSNCKGGLIEQAGIIERLAQCSFSMAFSLWGHRMVIEFLAMAGGDFVERMLPRLRAGTTLGASAMAPGYKALAGIGDLGLRVTKGEDGKLRLNGRISWATNLYPDALVIAPAYGPRTPADAKGAAGGVVVAFALSGTGITIGPKLDLLAMRGTASTYVELNDVPLHADQILSTEFMPFLQRTRPTLSILQASFCLGLATTSYEHAIQNATGINAFFAAEIKDQGRKLVETKKRLIELAEQIGTATPPQPKDILTMRLNAGQLGVTLALLELKTSGGRGFVTTSDTNRRYRESTFIPLQSPSEAQLRWEIKQLTK